MPLALTTSALLLLSSLSLQTLALHARQRSRGKRGGEKGLSREASREQMAAKRIEKRIHEALDPEAKAAAEARRAERRLQKRIAKGLSHSAQLPSTASSAQSPLTDRHRCTQVWCARQGTNPHSSG